MLDNAPILTPENFINRELSTLEFNRRVLALAKDKNIPLLERIKFIAIVGSNLDEFYMVRVSSYVQKHKLGISKTRPDGYHAGQLLTEIRKRTTALMSEQRQIMRQVLSELEEHRIHIITVNQLKNNFQQALRAYFHEEVFPVLTPLAVDHARPFPFISNLSLNLGVYLERVSEDHHETYDFVRIKVPEALPRLINVNTVLRKYTGQTIDDDSTLFVWIEDIISENLDMLFPGMKVVETHPFRVTRNADIDYEHEQEEELYDISAVIEESVRERQFGSVVRLSVPEDISKRMLSRLIHELNVDPDRDVYFINGALGSSSLFGLLAVDRPDLKYPPHVPKIPEELANKDIFSAIRTKDILLHHPYDSFLPVEEFFKVAANDPQVLAIKATLYRVGKNSPIVQALMEARANDKQVAVLVELKARFDEENNLVWARALEEKGVHVTYGVEELPVKTHAKIALVVRKEADGVRRYVHLGTGNYNASTARLYTDLGLFTCNEEIGDDATRLFNRLTGYAPHTTYNRLLVAPEYLLPNFLELIDNEINAAKNGLDAHLIFKMNQLEEDTVIRKLYEASLAGVKVDLVVRGLCCLQPGIPNLSDNIRVISIVGRFLEHSRVYYFKNAPDEHRIYLGSADLMRRNLHNRVETVFPILDKKLQEKIIRMINLSILDTYGTWVLKDNNHYEQVVPEQGEVTFDSQSNFINNSFGTIQDFDVVTDDNN